MAYVIVVASTNGVVVADAGASVTVGAADVTVIIISVVNSVNM